MGEIYLVVGGGGGGGGGGWIQVDICQIVRRINWRLITWYMVGEKRVCELH